jgi:hypothetical protein
MMARFKNSEVRLAEDILTLSTGTMARQFRWNGGALQTIKLTELASNTSWECRGENPDVQLPVSHPCTNAELTTRLVELTATSPAYLEATVHTRHGNLEMKRVFRLYPGVPAIAGELYLKGTGLVAPTSETRDASAMSQLENADSAAESAVRDMSLDRLELMALHTRVKAVQFFDITDRRNNLTRTTELIPYPQPERLAGNLLLLEDQIEARRLFCLKEAPCSDVQLDWPGADFSVERGQVVALGIGIPEPALSAGDWVRGYGLVVGVSTGDELALFKALRAYQRSIRTFEAERDCMILQNTWGDRGQDRQLGEAFSLAELEAASKLGVTHFQLDDGWQTGRSCNSAFGGSLENIWNNERYWTVDADKYPNDLFPVLKKAKDLGIELCLWFNPSKDDSYVNWRKDAECLINLNRRYGIRTFKIDGVNLPDKTAEINFRRFLDTVSQATRGQAVFNLDVTAGRRFGYHLFNEYGNKFLENRYTDWGNYYPHWTLRNLWMLSAYVPTPALQVEFLNKWRNGGNYAQDDPLSPINVPFEYCFAITLMAQPLAWFEGSNLPAEAFEIAAAIRAYRRHQAAIHGGTILPIGGEPSGFGWTGFQSIRDKSGYLAIYREHCQAGNAEFPLWGLKPGTRLKLETVCGAGQQTELTVSGNGQARFELPGRFSYALYRYEVL